jgi:pimeloyl-ACP methyl ester carboxylesterase
MSETTTVTANAALTLETRLARFPAQQIAIARQQVVSYREAAGANSETLPLVLLHGIGSGAASWVQQFEALGATRRVFAWDAPGYGDSTPVAAASPAASDYSNVLKAWLDALGIARCVLVGHSLGAIIAGAFAAANHECVAGLLLISPAGGYGAASPNVRASKRDARLAMLADLGPAGLAEKRSANMLSSHADETARHWARWNMSRVVPHGYAQATRLLANADLASDLAAFTGRVAVAVGAEDSITQPVACERLAQIARAPFQIVPRAGHAGYIEAPAAYNAILDTFCRASETRAGTRSL